MWRIRRLRAARDLARDFAHELGGFKVVADHLVDLIGEKIAGGALDQSRLPEHADRRRVRVAGFLDVAPLFEQHREVAHEVPQAGALGDGAHDDAHALGHGELLHDLAQAGPFLGVLDLARDSELLGVGHQHEVAARQRDVGGDPRSLVADRALGHLDHDFRPDRIDVRGCPWR
jgi:hypothetical protein